MNKSTGSLIEAELAEVKRMLQAQLKTSNNARFLELKDDDADDSSMFDPRLAPSSRGGRSRALKFVKPGSYVKQAQNLRIEQLTEMRLPSFTKEDHVVVVPGNKITGSIPSTEWWDHALVDDQYGCKAEVITSLVVNPAPMQPIIDGNKVVPLPLMLTVTERKKIRRMRKQEKQKEKQDKIALGLIPAPEDKVTLSSFMRILSNEAVEDPTAVEAKVRAQMEKRRLAHEMHNEAHKLTNQEKREKKRLKLQEDTASEVHRCVFWLPNVENESNRFKICINAEQFNLSGVLLINSLCSMVLVEGGPNGIRKYSRLLMERMDWNLRSSKDMERSTIEGKELPLLQNQKCGLLWQGCDRKRLYSGFRHHICLNEDSAVKYLAEKGLGNFWKLARDYA